MKKNVKYFIFLCFLCTFSFFSLTFSKYVTTFAHSLVLNTRKPEYDVVFYPNRNILPSEYVEVGYLGTDGGQYINLGNGNPISSNTKVEIGAEFGESWLYGYTAGDGGRYGGTQKSFYTGTALASFEGNNDYHDFVFDHSSGVTVDGTFYSLSGTPSGSSGSHNIYLFRAFNSTVFVEGKIYYYRQYENDTLVYNLVPCYRVSDNVAGMYDLVSNTFFTNSGTGDFTIGYRKQHFVYGTAQNLLANSITKEGYTFAGWNTKEDGIGKAYADRQSVQNLTTVDGGEVILYGQWQSNTYTITYDYNGGVDESRVLGKWNSSDSSNNATTLIDQSGKGQNGTITNAILNNDSIKFNGSSSIVRFGAMNSNYMTLEATFSTDQLNKFVYALSNVQVGGIGVGITGQNKFLGIAYINGGYRNVISSITSEIGKKYHVIFSYDGVVAKLFVNGKLENSLEISGTIRNAQSSTVMALGCNPQGKTKIDGDALNGKIYSAAVYSHVNNSKKVTYDLVYGDLPVPYREGYTFDGWYIDENKVDSNSTVKITKNTRLVAKYIPNTYTIKYHVPEGVEMEDTVVDYDTEVYLRPVDYSGYSYFRWYTQPDKQGIYYTDGENVLNLTSENQGVVHLYPMYAYTISYQLDGGTLSNENPFFYHADTETFTLNNPSKAGYDFIGWTGSNGDTPELEVTVDAQSVSGDLEYTANYVPHKLRIQYHINGGSLKSNHGSSIDVDENGYLLINGSTIFHAVNYGERISSSGLFDYNNPNYINIEKTGYYIEASSAWNSQSDGSGTSYNQVVSYAASSFSDLKNSDETVTLYANWKPITYSIIFHKNSEDATGEMGNQTFTFNQSQNLSVNTFEREGYHFVGWNDKEDGTGTSYSDGQEVNNLMVVNNGQITLYAQWEQNE